MIKFFRDAEIVAIFYIFLSVIATAIGMGINTVILPNALVERGITSFFVGISAFVEIAASIAITFFLSKIVSKMKATKAALLFGALYMSSVLLMYFYQNYALWLAFCAINGACWCSLLVIRQAWINHLIENKNRSIILALGSTIFYSGYAIGSFIVKYLGADNYNSFIISASFIIFSCLVLILCNKTEPKKIDSERIGFREFFKHNPRCFIARFLLDMMMSSIIFLTIVFGVKIGFSAENSGLLIASFMASGFFDVFAGFIVKKYDRYKVIKLGFILCTVTMSLAFIFYHYFIAMLIFYFLFGTSAALIFIAALTITNESFAKEKLTAANSSLQSIGSLGSLAGCIICGILMEVFSFYGFFITIIFGGLSYLTFEYFYEKNKVRS